MDQKKDKFKWFMTFLIFGFVAVFGEAITAEYSSFQSFARTLIDSSFPFAYDGVSLVLALIVSVFSYITATFLGRILNGIIDNIFDMINMFIADDLDSFEVNENGDEKL